jgi:hypothetical protein
LVSSPSYLKRRGTPRGTAELKNRGSEPRFSKQSTVGDAYCCRRPRHCSTSARGVLRAPE